MRRSPFLLCSFRAPHQSPNGASFSTGEALACANIAGIIQQRGTPLRVWVPLFLSLCAKNSPLLPFSNDKEVSSLASDDSGHRPKTPRAFKKARAKLSDLVCANMASRHIIKSVGSVLSDGFFPYSKFNFELALKKGHVPKPLSFKFFGGLEPFSKERFQKTHPTRPRVHAPFKIYILFSIISTSSSKARESSERRRAVSIIG